MIEKCLTIYIMSIVNDVLAKRDFSFFFFFCFGEMMAKLRIEVELHSGKFETMGE